MLRVPVFSGSDLWVRRLNISGVFGKFWSVVWSDISYSWGENDCYSCLWGGEHYWDLTWGDGE